jgi:hypothetical protein
VSAIEDLSWKKWSSAYAVCRFFFKDQKWPKSSLSGSEKPLDLVMFSLDSFGIVRGTRAKENRPVTNGQRSLDVKRSTFTKKG